MSESFAALQGALGAVRAAGVPLILLRHRELDAVTAAEAGDYDLLAPDSDYDRTIEIIHASLLETRASYRVHAAKPEKRLIVLFDPESASETVVDLWREHRILARRTAGRHTEGFLLYSTLAPCCRLEGDVLRMPAWLELAVYLGHLLEKKKDLKSEGVKQRLLRYANKDAAAAPGAAELGKVLAAAPARLLAGELTVEAAAATAWQVLESLGLILSEPQRSGHFRWKLRRTFRSVERRLGRGAVVSIQGPDGSGKTTIVDSLRAEPPPGLDPSGSAAGSSHEWVPGRRIFPVVFKRLYRKSIFRILYKMTRKLRRLRNRAEPKEVVEVALAPFLFAGALLNYWLLQALRGRGRAFVFDRYFTDLLVTNRKDGGEELGLNSSGRWLERLVPRADCAVLLAVSSEALRARKAEMTGENARRYTSLLAGLYTVRPPRELLVLRTDVDLRRTLEILKSTLENVR